MSFLSKTMQCEHKIILRALFTSNRALTSFSESPLHLLTKVDADILKNVVWHSEATAFANRVFPVPGGPCSKIPFHGLGKLVFVCVIV
jgi:hypothetical protein